MDVLNFRANWIFTHLKSNIPDCPHNAFIPFPQHQLNNPKTKSPGNIISQKQNTKSKNNKATLLNAPVSKHSAGQKTWQRRQKSADYDDMLSTESSVQHKKPLKRNKKNETQSEIFENSKQII
jgi:hypothetical protein